MEPDELVERHGADTVRAFLMFGYRWEEGGPWSDGSIHGVVRWLNRVWDLTQRLHARGGADGSAGPASDGERALLRVNPPRPSRASPTTWRGSSSTTVVSRR